MVVYGGVTSSPSQSPAYSSSVLVLNFSSTSSYSCSHSTQTIASSMPGREALPPQSSSTPSSMCSGGTTRL